MTERIAQHLACSVVVARLTETDIRGDTLADELRDELLSLYLGSGATHLVIDFGAVAYLSSAGFRPLLRLNRQVRENGGRLVLCNFSPEVEEIFAVTRLISNSKTIPAAFEAQPNVAAAVASLYQPLPDVMADGAKTQA
jgi:anti-anti-sigma factor